LRLVAAADCRPGEQLLEMAGVGAIIGAMEFSRSMNGRAVEQSAERLNVEDIVLPDASIARRGKASDFAIDIRLVFSMDYRVAELCHYRFARPARFDLGRKLVCSETASGARWFQIPACTLCVNSLRSGLLSS